MNITPNDSESEHLARLLEEIEQQAEQAHEVIDTLNQSAESELAAMLDTLNVESELAALLNNPQAESALAALLAEIEQEHSLVDLLAPLSPGQEMSENVSSGALYPPQNWPEMTDSNQFSRFKWAKSDLKPRSFSPKKPKKAQN